MARRVKRDFIDSGLVIAVARGTPEMAVKAVAILDDPDREFASSIFVKLEVLPKPLYYRYPEETQFYERFFQKVRYWAEDFERIIPKAFEEACTAGLEAMDALHVASAISVGCDELVTTEGPTKPIHRVKSIKIVTIHDDASTVTAEAPQPGPVDPDS